MMISPTSNYTESVLRDFFKINLTLIDTSIRVKEIINFKDIIGIFEKLEKTNHIIRIVVISDWIDHRIKRNGIVFEQYIVYVRVLQIMRRLLVRIFFNMI